MNLTDELRKEYAPGVPYYTDSYDQIFVDYLLGSADRYPNRVAINFLSRETTYAELLGQVRQAATVLREAGVGRGSRVALIMPNCPQHIVTIFATALLGAVVVEHNPLAPKEELRSEFDRHKAKVVVAWENAIENLSFLDSSATIFGVNLAEALPRASQLLLKFPIPAVKKKKSLLGAPVPSFVRSWDREVRAAEQWEGKCPAKPEDPALFIHTGGTTGVPKAVVLSHKNLSSNIVQSLAWVPPLHEGAEVFYSILPYFHAYGFTATLMTGIHLGATIAVFPKFDVAQVLLAQKRLPCTFFVGVPPIFERLLIEADNLDSDLTSIRFTLSGAMPLSQELSDRWEQATGSYVVEGYGMTEASPVLLGSPLSENRRAGALGLPYPSTEIRIVNPENTDIDTPEGEIGELIARGPQVFSGYLDDEEETAQVLKDGWLHTGDLVQVRDGFIYMADRRKELILAGGFNVYPSQVEDAVRGMPGISDVAVVGLPGGNRGEDVIAALVLEAGASVTLAGVRTWAEKSLAHYALPRQIVVIQELPRSQIGKVMRRRVAQQLSDLQTGFETTMSSLATQVTEIGEKAEHARTAFIDSLAAASATGDRSAETAEGDEANAPVAGDTQTEPDS